MSQSAWRTKAAVARPLEHKFGTFSLHFEKHSIYCNTDTCHILVEAVEPYYVIFNFFHWNLEKQANQLLVWSGVDTQGDMVSVSTHAVMERGVNIAH